MRWIDKAVGVLGHTVTMWTFAPSRTYGGWWATVGILYVPRPDRCRGLVVGWGWDDADPLRPWPRARRWVSGGGWLARGPAATRHGCALTWCGFVLEPVWTVPAVQIGPIPEEEA